MVAAALIVFTALKPAPPPPLVASDPAPVTPAPAPPPAEEPKAEVPAQEEPKTAETKAPRRRTEAASSAVPVRDGVVHLAVAPWGEVYVDGAARGVSPPLTQLTLPPGPHTIEVRNGSAPPLVVRIELRSGETISLQHRF
jgi:serine/threonine-protein kinase